MSGGKGEEDNPSKGHKAVIQGKRNGNGNCLEIPLFFFSFLIFKFF